MVTAIFFGCVQGCICRLDELRRVVCRLGTVPGVTADAQRHMQFVQKWVEGYSFQQILGGMFQLFPRCIGQDENEFIPAEAAGNIGRPRCVFDGLGYVLQNHIADVMAPFIIDLFKKIDIDQQQAYLQTVDLQTVGIMVHMGQEVHGLIDVTSIEKVGQKICVGFLVF